jgi:hypothetical protein
MGMSNMRRLLPLFLVLVLGAAVTAACIDDSGSTGSRRGDSYPTKVVDAPIDGLEVLIRETAPPSYAVRIVSGLPSGCAKFEAWEITGRSGTEITIRVTNRMPDSDDVACTMIYGTHESVVDLGSDFVSGTTYTVVVNGEPVSFTAQ